MNNLRTDNNLISSALRKSSSSSLNSIIQQREDGIKAQTKGSKFKDLAEMHSSGMLKHYDHVQSKLYSTQMAIISNGSAENFMNAQFGALTYLHELIGEVEAAIVEVSPATPGCRIKMQADHFFDRIIVLLNQEYALNGYIFGGGMKQSPPIPDSEYFKDNSNIVNNEATRNYTDIIPYEGELMIGYRRTISADVDATNPCFAEVIASIHLLKGICNNDPNVKKEIFTRLATAREHTGIIMARISQNLRAIETENQRSQSDASYATEIYDTSFRYNVIDGFVRQHQNTASLESMAYSLRLATESSQAAAKKLFEG